MSSFSSPQAKGPVVAIDGPAGAGKSTVAAHLARRFGLLNLETGAMYRAFALKALQDQVSLEDERALMALSLHTRITLEPEPSGNLVLLDGLDVSRRIREADVTAAASRISVHPRVRQWMVEQQRLLGQQGNVVMEGRDIGTVVFPHATLKIFLDASPETRGSRRFRQNEPSEGQTSHETVTQEMKERDERDRNRTDSPLRPANDAVLLNTTNLSLDEVLRTTEELVFKALTPA